MSYQIVFDGAASAELTHLLHAVQHQLNGRGIRMLAQSDAQAQTTTTGAPVKPGVPCSNSQPGHDPNCVHNELARDPNTYIGLVIGIIVGFGLSRFSRKNANNSAGTR